MVTVYILVCYKSYVNSCAQIVDVNRTHATQFYIALYGCMAYPESIAFMNSGLSLLIIEQSNVLFVSHGTSASCVRFGA
jgi:hypothetical protein